MITKNEIKDITEVKFKKPKHISEMLEDVFNRDLRPDINVLLNINSQILNCECGVISSHPDFERYMRLQTKYTKFLSELVSN